MPSLYDSVTPTRGNTRDGLRFDELIGLVGSTRAGMAAVNRYWEPGAVALRDRLAPRGQGVLARAMRAARPGVVFALAAQAGEVDPLKELTSRLFVGLPAEASASPGY